MAARKRTVRTLTRPPPMKLLPRHRPDWRVKGARPARAAISRRSSLPAQATRPGGCGRPRARRLGRRRGGPPSRARPATRAPDRRSPGRAPRARPRGSSSPGRCFWPPACGRRAGRAGLRPPSSRRSGGVGRRDRRGALSPRPAAAGPRRPSRGRNRRSRQRRSGRSWRAPGGWKHVNVELVLRDVDADGDGIHLVPSLSKRASHAAQATVRVRWNDGRRPSLTHGLDHPRAFGPAPATAPASIADEAIRNLQEGAEAIGPCEAPGLAFTVSATTLAA